MELSSLPRLGVERRPAELKFIDELPAPRLIREKKGEKANSKKEEKKGLKAVKPKMLIKMG